MKPTFVVLGLVLVVVMSAAPLLAAGPEAERPMTESACTAEAECWNGSVVSCSGNTECYARDDNCPYYDGYVRCDSSYQFCGCPLSCPLESEGCFDDEECRGSFQECQECFCDPHFRICTC